MRRAVKLALFETEKQKRNEFDYSLFFVERVGHIRSS